MVVELLRHHRRRTAPQFGGGGHRLRDDRRSPGVGRGDALEHGRWDGHGGEDGRGGGGGRQRLRRRLRLAVREPPYRRRLRGLHLLLARLELEHHLAQLLRILGLHVAQLRLGALLSATLVDDLNLLLEELRIAAVVVVLRVRALHCGLSGPCREELGALQIVRRLWHRRHGGRGLSRGLCRTCARDERTRLLPGRNLWLWRLIFVGRRRRSGHECSGARRAAAPCADDLVAFFLSVWPAAAPSPRREPAAFPCWLIDSSEPAAGGAGGGMV